MAKKISNDRPDSASAMFEEATLPSNGSEGLAVQVRILGPPDVTTELKGLLSEHGFTVTGSEPEKNQEDRLRTYLIAPVKQFRRQHHLDSLEFPKFIEPAKPAVTREQLTKRLESLQTELMKATVLEREALAGTDAAVVAKAKQNRDALTQMLTHVGWEMQRWAKHDAELAQYTESSRKLDRINELVKNPPLCPECGFSTRLIRRPSVLGGLWGQRTAKYFLDYECTNEGLPGGRHRFRIEPDEYEAEEIDSEAEKKNELSLLRVRRDELQKQLAAASPGSELENITAQLELVRKQERQLKGVKKR